MRFTAERDVILSALSFVAKYAAKDRKVPILSHISIRAENDSVSLVATDIDAAASDRFAASVARPGSACLPASMLLGAVKGSTGPEAVVDADDKQASVTCGKSRFKLPVLPVSDFPDLAMLHKDASASFMMSASTLARLEKEVAFAMEPEGGRYFLIGTSWAKVGQSLEFCATDGKRLSLMSIDAPKAEIPSIIVPRFSVPAWDGDVEISISELFIRLRSGSQTVASKLIEATYPDYHRLIPMNDVPLLFDRSEFHNSISRMALIADAKEHSILLVGRNGVVSISAVTSTGEASDEISYHGDDFQIAVTHSNLISILASFRGENIEMRWAGHDIGVTFHDPADPARISFAMPYRDRRLNDVSAKFQEAAE